MKESELSVMVVEFLRQELRSESGLAVLERTKIPYGGKARRNRSFQVDVAVQEGNVPRVLVELKASGISTDAMLAYSNKADLHKALDGSVRYGLFVAGDDSAGITSKWFWHGHAFDFMISCRSEHPTESELAELAKVVKYELGVSRELERLISGDKGRDWPWLVWRRTHIK